VSVALKSRRQLGGFRGRSSRRFTKVEVGLATRVVSGNGSRSFVVGHANRGQQGRELSFYVGAHGSENLESYGALAMVVAMSLRRGSEKDRNTGALGSLVQGGRRDGGRKRHFQEDWSGGRGSGMSPAVRGSSEKTMGKFVKRWKFCDP
ncbi:hypothetical protein LINPERPRIM_LOCUS37921, partial [Linum perenne]